VTPFQSEQLQRDGWLLLPGVFSVTEVDAILYELETALADEVRAGPIRSGNGLVYASRNVADLWPGVTDVWRVPVLEEALAATLGASFGLVRVLYFDKPPGGTWALPWHKDLTIAVRDNALSSDQFTKPTIKAGVAHVEAPLDVLQQMLTARIHLDPADEENGALRVVSGSHQTGKLLTLTDKDTPTVVRVAPGDVLLMRPLLAHSSGRSHPETVRHRRIVHLEFAAKEQLVDGFAWRSFFGRKVSC
jgi:Phytanoyl-CoA dioxygenase (PhyH)